MKKLFVFLVVIAILIGAGVIGARMGMFDFMKVYLFSEIGGVVTMDGKPVSGVEVVRTTDATIRRGVVDRTVTDAQGRFHFDAIAYPTLQYFYRDANILQGIEFRYKGKVYPGWDHLKNNYDRNGETDEHLSLTKLTCDLSKSPINIEQELSSPINSICFPLKK